MVLLGRVERQTLARREALIAVVDGVVVLAVPAIVLAGAAGGVHRVLQLMAVVRVAARESALGQAQAAVVYVAGRPDVAGLPGVRAEHIVAHVAADRLALERALHERDVRAELCFRGGLCGCKGLAIEGVGA